MPAGLLTFSNGAGVAAFSNGGGGARVASIPAGGGGAPPLELPTQTGEIALQAHALVIAADDPHFVWQDPVNSNAPSSFSKGTLPGASDNVVVHGSGKLVIPAGTTLTCKVLRIDGKVEIGDGATIDADTIIAMNGGDITALTVNWTISCRNETDIDVGRDTELIGRGLVLCELSTYTLVGKERQLIHALSNDIAVGGTSLTLAISPQWDADHAVAYDWAAGDKLLLLATELTDPSSTLGLTGEVVEIASAVDNVNSTAFGTHDPTGTVITLVQGATFIHEKYRDAVGQAVLEGRGPPSGSHALWAGRPMVALLSRTAKFTVSNSAFSDHHRRPMLLIASPSGTLGWFEMDGWGRQSMETEAIRQEGKPNPLTPTTNLRYRAPVNFYRAGRVGGWGSDHNQVADLAGLQAIPEDDVQGWGHWRNRADTDQIYRYDPDAASGDVAPSDQTGGTGFWIEKPYPKMTGASIWGGAPGNIKSNGEVGKGSMGPGITQYDCHLTLDRCLTFNTAGPGVIGYDHTCTSLWKKTLVSNVWGRPATGNSGNAKDGTNIFPNLDGGQSGAAYWSFSRELEMRDPMAFGCDGEWLAVMARGDDLLTFDTQYSRIGPEVYGFEQFTNKFSQPPINIRGAYAQACEKLLWITKPGDEQFHGFNSQFKNCVAINCGQGFHIEYIAQYRFADCLVLGLTSVPAGYRTTQSVEAFNVTTTATALSFIDCYSANFDKGLRFTKDDASGPLPDDDTVHYRIVNFTSDNVTTPIDNALAAEQFTRAKPYATAFGIALSPHPSDVTLTDDFADPPENGKRFVTYEGTYDDDLDTSETWPLGNGLPNYNDSYDFTIQQLYGVLAHHGYWTDSVSSALFVRRPLWRYNPLTGERRVSYVPQKIENLIPGLGTKWVDEQSQDLPFFNHGTADFAAIKTAVDAELAVQ